MKRDFSLREERAARIRAMTAAIVARSRRSVSAEEVIRRLNRAPAPRFYVSFQTARGWVWMLEGFTERAPKITRQMRDFYERFRRNWARHGKLSTSALVRMTIFGGAPSHYVTRHDFSATRRRRDRERKLRADAETAVEKP